MKSQLHYTLIALLLAINVHLYPAQQHNLHFNQISTKDGLSQNTVRAILEDQKGFIWAGTLDGLNRYDGYRIVSYKPQVGKLNSLIDHRVKDVFQDKEGYLWIKTYENEFCCYNPITDSFVPFQTPLTPKNAFYNNYFESQQGSIWLWGNTHGCLRITNQNGNFKTTSFLDKKRCPNQKNCKFLMEDTNHAIWIGGENGLYRIVENRVDSFFTKKYNFTKAVELNNKLYLSTNQSVVIEYDLKRKSFQEITCTLSFESFVNIAKLSNTELILITKSAGLIAYNTQNQQFGTKSWMNDPQLKGTIGLITDRKKGLWFFNHTGILWYYNQATQQHRKLELIPPEIVQIIDFERYNVFIDSENLIWITTYGNGLFCYNPETDLLENYTYNATKNSPASDYLLSITEDKYGTIWIGSEYAGIIQVVKSTDDIQVIRPEKETSIGKNNNVRAIYEDALNRIWIGTKNGSLYLYSPDLNTHECVHKDINPYAMTEDGNNQLWVGTKGKGLYIIDNKSFKIKGHYLNQEENNTSLSSNTLFSILKDSQNRMWLGSFGGGLNLAHESEKGVTFTSFFADETNRSYIRHLFQDTKGDIWAGTSDGIIRFNPDQLIKDPTAYTLFKMDLTNKNSINCNDIKTIYEDEEGTIWIGTAGGGLNKHIAKTTKKEEHFIAYTTANGLAGDFISSILEDEDYNLWVSTESGVSKFDKLNNSFITHRFSEKTYGNHFNENANVFSHSGKMLLGSLDGVLIFSPNSLSSEETTRPVTLTDFFLHDQNVTIGAPNSPLKQSITYCKEITLTYKQNSFTIGFATLTLKDPTKNKYVYKLENYDKQWSTISHLNDAAYKNLAPGNYVFKVKGSNSDGVWNEEITELRIQITPPFWKSGIAYLGYSIVLILMLYVALRLIYKFNALNNNIKVEKELTNFKLRFFTNISHEFRTPLTIIRGAVENLNDQQDASPQIKKQVNVLSRNSTILTRLIDQLLEFRKLQNNVLTLDLEETDLIEFAKDIYTSFQEVAEQKNIEYLFSAPSDPYFSYIDRQKVDKILYNLLSNAFKFTPKRGKIELILTFNEPKKTCLIQIKDNGIGVGKEKQHLLFSRFMQINFSADGTGVGLSLVKEFVEVHKGKIWHEANDTQGSIFNVELSTQKEHYQGANFIHSSCSTIIKQDANNKILYPSDVVENIQIPDIDDSTLANYRMLVIDDNDDIRNFLTDEFSKHFMVDTAEDGQLGLQKAIDTNPDLIICDVMMPEMDGFELTRRLKDNFHTCHIPIILLTAHSSQEHQLEGIQSGADAYIMKPFSLKFLVARVFKLIQQREQLKKRFSNEYILDGKLITSTDQDKDFFTLIDQILEEHLDNTQFSVDQFAELANQRRTIFYKKVKGITGLSPNELIKLKRLKKAAELVLKGELTIAEISYKVGFDDPFYFSKCFKAQFNCSPSKYGQTSKQ